MSQYNVFQAIYMSFYSRSLYQDVGKNWGGKTFFYLAILIALSWVGFTIKAQATLNRIYGASSDAFIAEIPIIKIQKGKISTPEMRPYFIKEPGSNKTFAVIDATSTTVPAQQVDVTVYINEKNIIYKKDENETRVYQIPESYSGTIDPAKMNVVLKRIVSFAWALIFPLFFLVSYFYRIFQVVIYGLIGKLYCAVSNTNVNFGAIMQITMVAITPAIVISTVLDLFSITYPYELLVYFVISMCYMIYGIRYQ